MVTPWILLQSQQLEGKWLQDSSFMPAARS
jgi:hypothetical protein